jgi:hypothetical protein
MHSLFEAPQKVSPTTGQASTMESRSAISSFEKQQSPPTDVINVAIATSSPCGALGSPRQLDVFRLVRRNASESASTHETKSAVHTPPIVTATAIMALEAKDKDLAIKTTGHPLAFFQSTFATATSGFNARRRQRLTPTTEAPNPRSTLGVQPTANQVAEAAPVLPTAAYPLDIHADTMLTSPGWYTGSIVNISSSLLPYAAVPFAHLRQELKQLACAIRSALDVLLTKTRHIKEPMRRYIGNTMGEKQPILGPHVGAATKEAAEVVIERAWDELHLVLNNLESQMIRLRMHGDEALLQAQRASRRTIKQARQGLDNVLRETADIVERHTGKEIPLPKSVQRKRIQDGPPPSTISEKFQQLLYHVSCRVVMFVGSHISTADPCIHRLGRRCSCFGLRQRLHSPSIVHPSHIIPSVVVG